jgi:hypothetical protein
MIAYLLILTVLYTVLSATADGTYDNGKKQLSAILENSSLATLVAFTAIVTAGLIQNFISIPLWKIIVGFVGIRFALFDIIYNKTRKLPTFFYGTTKLYDRIMTKLASWGWFVKFIIGLTSIVFLINL